MRTLRNALDRFGILIGVALLVLALAILEGFAEQPARRPAEASPPWATHIESMDTALAKRDISAAVTALHATYLAALGSRRWEGMVVHGNAAMRLADVTGVRRPWIEKARQSYLMALLRARSDGDLEGVFRAAEGFHRLGDRDAADFAVRTAQRMANQARPSDRPEEMARLDDGE